MVSTVIGTDMDGFLDHSLERIKYRASEMPQAFQYSLIRAAYDKVRILNIFCQDLDEIWERFSLSGLERNNRSPRCSLGVGFFNLVCSI